MNITNIKYQSDGNVIVALDDGRTISGFNKSHKRKWKIVQKWLDKGNKIEKAEKEKKEKPPTENQIITKELKDNPILKAFIYAINDGSIVPGADVHGTVLRAVIKDHMK